MAIAPPAENAPLTISGRITALAHEYKLGPSPRMWSGVAAHGDSKVVIYTPRV